MKYAVYQMVNGRKQCRIGTYETKELADECADEENEQAMWESDGYGPYVCYQVVEVQ